ncbi:MAG TPA: DUF4446 family protein [Candidatus Doudnabacteria bacterium]|nr:DUF4446 family protein [Candidatus Doudnabacteria bacterium]
MQNLEIISLVIAVLAFAGSIVALVFSNKLRQLRQLLGPEQQPDNLEEVLTSLTEKLKSLKTDHNQLVELVGKQGATLETAFQYSAVVRFDSGGSDGGNLSFALALLDGQQNGFIITSLHGREHNRIYCKPILNGASQVQLSEEEQEALITALTNRSSAHKTNNKTK